METYSTTKTILVWTKNKELISFASEIAEELYLNIYLAKDDIDLIAVPCFLMLVDTEKLRDDFLLGFNQFAKEMEPEKSSIIVFGKRLRNVPFSVRPLLKYANSVITKEYIFMLINKAMKPRMNIKHEIFKQRIHRIIYMYKLLDEGKVIISKEFSEFFDVSDRTIRRDIKILREVCDQEIFFDKDRGYYLDK
jgi:hypothetical protein